MVLTPQCIVVKPQCIYGSYAFNWKKCNQSVKLQDQQNWSHTTIKIASSAKN